MRSWAVLLLVSSSASARPLTVGIADGITQTEANSNADPDHALSLWGRIGLAPAFAVQLELQRVDGADPNLQTRAASALAVLDLARGQLVPLVLAGVGLDRGSEYMGEIDAHRFEAGAGLEYRASGGLVVGADLRIGDRTIDSDTRIVPLTYYSPRSTLTDGQYRSARVTVGVRF